VEMLVAVVTEVAMAEVVISFCFSQFNANSIVLCTKRA
jgi:hypothetical protein